jgi:hypothetical protein
MTQLNLKMTLYVVFLLALGVVWPWDSANAYDPNCGKLTIAATFGTVNCTAVFTCTTPNCWTDSPPLAVNTADMTCTRGTTSCTDPPDATSINYDPRQEKFTSPTISFPGYSSSPVTPRCNCTTITLNNDTKMATATTCRRGTPTTNPPYIPPTVNQVFPAPIGGTNNFSTPYTITTPDSPNCSSSR